VSGADASSTRHDCTDPKEHGEPHGACEPWDRVGVSDGVEPVLIAAGCVKEEIGDDDGEHGPGDRLASREGEREERMTRETDV
jgi:hypothetical protein